MLYLLLYERNDCMLLVFNELYIFITQIIVYICDVRPGVCLLSINAEHLNSLMAMLLSWWCMFVQKHSATCYCHVLRPSTEAATVYNLFCILLLLLTCLITKSCKVQVSVHSLRWTPCCLNKKGKNQAFQEHPCCYIHSLLALFVTRDQNWFCQCLCFFWMK